MQFDRSCQRIGKCKDSHEQFVAAELVQGDKHQEIVKTLTLHNLGIVMLAGSHVHLNFTIRFIAKPHQLHQYCTRWLVHSVSTLANLLACSLHWSSYVLYPVFLFKCGHVPESSQLYPQSPFTAQKTRDSTHIFQCQQCVAWFVYPGRQAWIQLQRSNSLLGYVFMLHSKVAPNLMWF